MNLKIFLFCFISLITCLKAQRYTGGWDSSGTCNVNVKDEIFEYGDLNGWENQRNAVIRIQVGWETAAKQKPVYTSGIYFVRIIFNSKRGINEVVSNKIILLK